MKAFSAPISRHCDGNFAAARPRSKAASKRHVVQQTPIAASQATRTLSWQCKSQIDGIDAVLNNNAAAEPTKKGVQDEAQDEADRIDPSENKEQAASIAETTAKQAESESEAGPGQESDNKPTATSKEAKSDVSSTNQGGYRSITSESGAITFTFEPTTKPASSPATAKEPDVNEKLQNALAKIKLLEQQVSIVDELQEHLSEQDSLIADLEQLLNENRSKVDDVNHLRAQTKSLEEALSEAQKRLTNLQEQMEAQEDVQKQSDRDQERIKELNTMLEQARARNQELQSSLAATKRDAQEREAVARALQEQLGAAQAAARKAEAELEQTKAEVQEAQARLSKQEAEYAAVEADVEQMRKQVSSKNNRAGKGFGKPLHVAAGEKQQSSLRQALRMAQDEVEDLQSQLEEKDNALQAAYVRAQDIQDKLDSLEDVAKDLENARRQLTAQQDAVKGLESTRAEALQEAAKLREQVQEMELQLVETRQELEAAKNASTSANAHAEAMQRAAKEAGEAAERSLAEAKAAEAAAKADREATAALRADVGEVKKLSEEVDSMGRKLADIQLKLAAAEEARLSAEARALEAEARVAASAAKLAEASDDNGAVADDIAAITAERVKQLKDVEAKARAAAEAAAAEKLAVVEAAAALRLVEAEESANAKLLEAQAAAAARLQEVQAASAARLQEAQASAATRLQEAQAQWQQAMEELAASRAEADKYVKEIAVLRSQLGALQADSKGAVSVSTEQVTRTSSELDLARQRITELETERTSLQREAKQLHKLMTDLQALREKQDAAQSELESDLIVLKSEVDAFNDIRNELAVLAEAYQVKEAEAARLSVELKLAREREAALGRDLVVAKASLESVRSMVSDMQDTNDALAARLEELEERMQSGGQANEKVTEQLQAAEKTLQNTKQQLSQKDAALQEAQRHIQANAAEVTALRERLEANDRLVQQLQERESFALSELGEAKEVYTILSREVERLREELDTSQEEMESSTKMGEMSKLQKEISNLQQVLSQRDEEINAAHAAREASDQQLASASATIQTLTAELTAARAALAAANAMNASQQSAAAQQQGRGMAANVSSLDMFQVQALQSELVAEAEATSDLLKRAESLLQHAIGMASNVNTRPTHNTNMVSAQEQVRLAAEADAAASKAALLEVELMKLQRDLSTTQQQLAVAQQQQQQPGGLSTGDVEALRRELEDTRKSATNASNEINALRKKVMTLEAELAGRDQQVGMLLDLTRKGRGGPTRAQQLATLGEQLAELTAQNTMLKASASRRSQLLVQTRKFLQERAEAAAAAAEAAKERASSSSQLSGGSSSSFALPASVNGNGTGSSRPEYNGNHASNDYNSNGAWSPLSSTSINSRPQSHPLD